jgi:hypothetical protein
MADPVSRGAAGTGPDCCVGHFPVRCRWVDAHARICHAVSLGDRAGLRTPQSTCLLDFSANEHHSRLQWVSFLTTVAIHQDDCVAGHAERDNGFTSQLRSESVFEEDAIPRQ